MTSISLASVCAESYWVKDGVAEAVIVVPEDRYPVTDYAAQELAYHIKLATGAELPVIPESEDGVAHAGKARIYLGNTDTARAHGIDARQLRPEETRLQANADKKAFFIVGNDAEGNPLSGDFIHTGTLWGVYEVLQRSLNVRWLWPGEQGVDFRSSKDLPLPEADEQFMPHFMTRELRTYTLWPEGTTRGTLYLPDQITAQDVGLAFSSPDEQQRYMRDQQIFLRRQRMGRSQHYTHSAGHDFINWWARYGKEHPEWFQYIPEKSGVLDIANLADRVKKAYSLPRSQWKGFHGPDNPEVPDLVSMNVSHPGLHQEIIRNWQYERTLHPDKKVPIAVGENDIWALDLSEASMALDAPQLSEQEIAKLPGSAQGQFYPFDAGRRYAWFYKRILELAREVDPEAVVNGYVYLNYFNVPKDIELSDGIILTFVPWGGWYYPRDPKEQTWLKEQWDGWKNTGARLLYRPNFTLDGGSMPLNYHQQMGEEFSYFIKNGCVGGDYDYLTGQWAAQGATLYVLVGQLSRPSVPVETLLAEFYGAFGPAGDDIREYYDFWESYAQSRREKWPAVMQRNQATNLLTYARASHELFPPSVFDQAEVILEKAEKAVASEARYADRVSFVRHGLTHARLSAALSRVFANPSSTTAQQQEAIEQLVNFRRSVEKLNIANFSVSGGDEIRSFGERYNFGARSETQERPADIRH